MAELIIQHVSTLQLAPAASPADAHSQSIHENLPVKWRDGKKPEDRAYCFSLLQIKHKDRGITVLVLFQIKSDHTQGGQLKSRVLGGRRISS